MSQNIDPIKISVFCHEKKYPFNSTPELNNNLLKILKQENPVSSTKTTEAPLASSTTVGPSTKAAPKTSTLPSTSASSSSSSSSSATTQSAPPPNQQPLISKSGVLRILSELVRSYAGCAKIITQHVYRASDFANQVLSAAGTDANASGQTTSCHATPILTEDCNALAFLLDNLLGKHFLFLFYVHAL